MTDRLIRCWTWVGAHRLLVGAGAAMLALVAFGGGVALGAAGPPATQHEREALTRPRTTVVRP